MLVWKIATVLKLKHIIVDVVSKFLLCKSVALLTTPH